MTDEHPFPETAAEMRAVADLIWGDHPELATIGDVRKAMTEKLNAMRQEQADIVATQNRNGEFYERGRRRMTDPGYYCRACENQFEPTYFGQQYCSTTCQEHYDHTEEDHVH